MTDFQGAKQTIRRSLSKLTDKKYKTLFVGLDLFWIATAMALVGNFIVGVGAIYVIFFALNLMGSYILPKLMKNPPFGRLNIYYVYSMKHKDGKEPDATIHFLPLFFLYWMDRKQLKHQRKDALKKLYEKRGISVSYGNTLTLHKINKEDPKAEYCVKMKKRTILGAKNLIGTILLNVFNFKNYVDFEVSRKTFKLFFNDFVKYKYTYEVESH